MAEANKNGGHAVVALGQDGVIYCDLYGHITGDTVKTSMRSTAELVRKRRAEGMPVSLIIDVSQVISQTSEARIRAKEVGRLGLDKLVVVGASRMLATVGRYIVKAGGMSSYTKFTRTRKQAQEWIKHGNKTVKHDDVAERNVAVGLAILVCTIAIAGLALGSTSFVKSVLPSINVMHPANAVICLVLCVAILCLKRGAIHGWRQQVAVAAGIFSVVSGLIATHLLTGAENPALVWALRDGTPNSIPPNAALNLLLLGVMLIAIATQQKRTWHRLAFHISSVALFVVTLDSIAVATFGATSLLGSGFTPLALSSALVFLFLNHALQTIAQPLPFFAKSMRTLNKNWQPIVVFVVMIMCVGLAWQQSLRDMRTNADNAIKEEFITSVGAIEERFSTTINTLRGFKGFFEASDNVSAAEYTNFYEGAKPHGGYPGFTAISFTRAVPAREAQAYINSFRQQAGAVATPKQFANARLNPVSSDPNHTYYAVTYVKPYSDTTSTFGFDSGTDPVRRAGFEKARDTGEPTASDTINLLAAQPTQAPRYGFVISIPVYRLAKGEAAPQTVEQRRQKIYGFVNSVFDNNVLFANILGSVADKSVKYVLTDPAGDTAIYTHNADAKDVGGTPTMTADLNAGGRQWHLDMYVPKDFGTTGFSRLVPASILSGGILLSILTAGLVFSLRRGREQAIALAANMTEDLSKEREAAVVAQQKDEAILSSIGDAVFAIDTEGRITLFNPAAEHSSGFDREEALGKHYRDILHFISEKDRTTNDSFIKKALSGHLAGMQNHTKLIRKDGKEIYVADSAAPIRDAKGDIIGAIIVFRDVTSDYALEQAKSEFVSLASHQLRTPLSAINWTSEMLLDGTMGKMTKEQTAQVQEIYDGNQRMIELVNSLLDVSRLEVGKLINAPAPTDMAELAASLEKEMTTSLTAKQMTLEKHISYKLAPVSADPKLLRMIVQNLLSNAIKYTPEKGKVTLTIRPATQAEIIAEKAKTGQPYVFLSVADTGYGIPKEQQRNIFQKMFRADNVRKMDVEGTGLGLYIVREVIYKLGGTIRFESKESLGTTFYVLIPFSTKATQLPSHDDVVK